MRLNTVEKYNITTNTWTEEAPLLVGKSDPSAGLVGSTIVAADGYTTSEDTGDNEAYNIATNKWSSEADPKPRNASCFGAISGQLYVAGGGSNGTPESTNAAFNATTTMDDACGDAQAVISPVRLSPTVSSIASAGRTSIMEPAPLQLRADLSAIGEVFPWSVPAASEIRRARNQGGSRNGDHASVFPGGFQ